MKKYKSINGHSGVIAYESGIDYIRIKFTDNRTYLYNYEKPGKIHVEEMKVLARSGKGLATYINVHVRENYFCRID